MVFRALRDGFNGLRGQWRLLLVYFAANFCFALLMAWPMNSLLGSFAGYRVEGARLAEGIDFEFLTELMEYESQAWTALMSLAAPVTVGYLLFSLFLCGGALTVLWEGRGYSASLFWSAAARHFGAFLRLALWALPLLAVLLIGLALINLLVELAAGGDPYESTTFWSVALQAGLAGIALLLISLFVDYGRIHIVTTGESKSIRALLEGIRFTLGNLSRTVGLVILLLLLSGLAALLYLPISNWLNAPHSLAVWSLILLQQLYVLWRLALRLTRYGGELSLFRTISRQDAKNAEKKEEPGAVDQESRLEADQPLRP